MAHRAWAGLARSLLASNPVFRIAPAHHQSLAQVPRGVSRRFQTSPLGWFLLSLSHQKMVNVYTYGNEDDMT
jgi:hypothetical protein